MRHWEVLHVQLVALLAAVVVSAQVLDPTSLSSERSSIERTYELTKYLEHQLREIKDTYLSYLGPPFSDPDFSPPRPNTTALSLPSAATRLDLWRGLENRARLAQNHRAYSVLLGAVKDLAHATLCPYLQSSLLHFSVGLDGLLGSISGLMTTLGYALPPQYYSSPAGGGAAKPQPLTLRYYELEAGPAAVMGPQSARYSQRNLAQREKEVKEQMESRVWRGTVTGRDQTTKSRQAEGSRDEGGGKMKSTSEELSVDSVGMEGWGKRKLLSILMDEELNGSLGPAHRTRTKSRSHMISIIEEPAYSHTPKVGDSLSTYSHNNKYSSDVQLQYEGMNLQDDRDRGTDSSYSSSSPKSQHRFSRSLPSSSSSFLTPTLHPPLSSFSLLYQFGAKEGHTLLSDGGPVPVLLPSPSLNDFSRKVESFWVLRELQSWLWRSAKDFNRLKKRLRV